MRIGIEAQRILRKKKHGMDMMAIELIKNLQKLDKVNDYYIFVNPDEDPLAIELSDNFNLVVLKKCPYPVWEQILLPRAVKTYKLDLLHCTSNTAPLALTVPLILTLHDIIYLEKLKWGSGSWYQRLGNLYRRWNVPLIVKEAARILTVSKFEEQRIKKRFNLGPKKIEVVYNGIGKHFRPTKIQEGSREHKQHQLPENYALFLGNMDPKKNLVGLLKAFNLLQERDQLSIELVITDLQENDLAVVLKELNAERLRPKIHLVGYVPNSELPAVYSHALFFLYISIRESFGLPILEAMSCKCPVITSNTSSMPEIAGDAALLVDPYDTEALCSVIYTLSNNSDLREELKEKGLQRPPLFSYHTRVKRILRIYQEVYRENHE